MEFETTYFHCGKYLKESLADSIAEIESVISAIAWKPEFKFSYNGKVSEHQTAYNKAFANEFLSREWEPQPLLRKTPKLIGDFRKGLVFIEIQFGNSSALYRDYYKFQYGLAHGLLSLAVLIVPTNPETFFPTRPGSVRNITDYSLAHTCFTILPINVPTLVIGLLPEN